MLYALNSNLQSETGPTLTSVALITVTVRTFTFSSFTCSARRDDSFKYRYIVIHLTVC